jgi:hypothetical protein
MIPFKYSGEFFHQASCFPKVSQEHGIRLLLVGSHSEMACRIDCEQSFPVVVKLAILYGSRGAIKKCNPLKSVDVYAAILDGQVAATNIRPGFPIVQDVVITGDQAAGSVYTIGTDLSERKLAMFLVQVQCNPGSGRIIPLGNLSTAMREGMKTADAYLRVNLKKSVSIAISKTMISRYRPST